jgi:hypothetical protein
MNIKPAGDFFRETKNAFQYLETDLNYRFISSDIENREHYPDTFAFVRYLGKKVGIEVYWYFASAAIDIALVEIAKEGEFPEKKRFWGESRGEAKAINLHTLMDMLGKSDLFMLRKLRVTKLSEVKKREKIIRENLSDVIENLAQILREQAKDILLGDTSIFSEVQKYESELLTKEYPY